MLPTPSPAKNKEIKDIALWTQLQTHHYLQYVIGRHLERKYLRDEAERHQSLDTTVR